MADIVSQVHQQRYQDRLRRQLEPQAPAQRHAQPQRHRYRSGRRLRRQQHRSVCAVLQLDDVVVEDVFLNDDVLVDDVPFDDVVFDDVVSDDVVLHDQIRQRSAKQRPNLSIQLSALLLLLHLGHVDQLSTHLLLLNHLGHVHQPSLPKRLLRLHDQRLETRLQRPVADALLQHLQHRNQLRPQPALVQLHERVQRIVCASYDRYLHPFAPGQPRCSQRAERMLQDEFHGFRS